MRNSILTKICIIAAGVIVIAGVGVFVGGRIKNKNSNETQQTTQSSSSLANGGTEENTTEEPVIIPGMAGWTPFEQNVTLRVPVYDRGIAGAVDVKDNFWTKWVQERFGDKWNITVEYVPVNYSDGAAGYDSLVQQSKLPTICMDENYGTLNQWVGKGYLKPYDIEEFKIIAPTYWNNMVSNGLDRYVNTADGDYFVLGTRPYAQTDYLNVTWYRVDWVLAAGYNVYPHVWSQEKKMLEEVKRLGLAEHPLGEYRRSGVGIDANHAYRTYPQDELTWATTGDSNIPALGTDAQYRLLKNLNEAYNLGLIAPDYAEKDEAAMIDDFINGRTISYSGTIMPDMEVLKACYEKNPDAIIEIKVCTGLVVDNANNASNAFRRNNIFGMVAGFSSGASDDEVKAAMMYLEWMTQPEVLYTLQWGYEGENFTRENGHLVPVADQSGLYNAQGYDGNYDYWCIITTAKSLGSIEMDIEANKPQGLPSNFYNQILVNYRGQLAVYEAGYAQEDCVFYDVIAAEATYGDTLIKKYEDYRNQLIMCPADNFDALYEQLSKEYMDAGYGKVMEERQTAFEGGRSTRLPKTIDTDIPMDPDIEIEN